MTALIQSAVGTTSGGSLATVSATLGATPTPGNLLVAVVMVNNSSVSTTPWGVATDITSITTGACRVAIYSTLAGGAEPTTVSAILNSALTTHRINVYEFSPTAGFTWTGLDKTASAQDAGSGVSTLTSGTTAATTSAEGVAVAGFSMNGTTGGTISLTNSHTALANTNCATGHLILTATGTQETTASWVTARRTAGAIAAYKQTVISANTGAGFLALL